MNVEHTLLSNGARVVTTAMPGVESVALGIWVGVGGRHEPAALSGVSHFLEHLLFKGTRHRTAREISQTIEGRGGELNASTQEESTGYYARVAAEHLWTALDILVDMHRNARLDPGDIRKEREVIIEEILMYRDQPQHQVDEWLGELLWPGHPLGRALTGRPETLRRLDRPTLLEFKRRTYVGRNLMFAFAGRVTHAECVAHVARHLRGLPAGRKPFAVPVDGGVRQGGLRVQSKEIEQTHLALGVRVFGRHDPRRYALKLLSVLLGENMSSRLFQTVRERHGLAYAIHSTVHLFQDTGVLEITAGLDSGRTERGVELIVGELARLGTRAPGSAELRRARDYVVGQMRMGLESTIVRMGWIADNFMSYGRFVPPEEVVTRLRAVTPDDVRRLAAELFRPQRISMAVIAPDLTPAREVRLARTLRRLA